MLLLLSLFGTADASYVTLLGTSHRGEATFVVSPFGDLSIPNTRFDPTDPDDPSQRLGPTQITASNGVGLNYVDPVDPGANASVVLDARTAHSTLLGVAYAADATLWDPADDLVDATGRLTTFRVASAGRLADVEVTLLQTVDGTSLVQDYELVNLGAAPLELVVTANSDVDVLPNGGFRANLAHHQAGWPGADAFPGVVTVTDGTERIGNTVSLQSPEAVSWRALRAFAVGWESYRQSLVYGVPASNVDGLFTYPTSNQLSSATRPYSDEIPDDLDGDGTSDALGDLGLVLQTTLTLPPGVPVTVTRTNTLFSGGPYLLDPCPPETTTLSDTLDHAFEATDGFGDVTHALTADSTLPAGLALVDGRLQGRATEVGSFVYTVEATDEKGFVAAQTCALEVLPPRYELTGTCPGTFTVSLSGLTPGGRWSVGAGSSGSLVVPSGVCAGTEFDIGGDFEVKVWGFADAEGTAEVQANVRSARQCPDHSQAIDFGSCAVSAVQTGP